MSTAGEGSPWLAPRRGSGKRRPLRWKRGGVRWSPPSWEQKDRGAGQLPGVGFGVLKGRPLPLLLALGSRRVGTQLARAGCLVQRGGQARRVNEMASQPRSLESIPVSVGVYLAGSNL